MPPPAPAPAPAANPDLERSQGEGRGEGHDDRGLASELLKLKNELQLLEDHAPGLSFSRDSARGHSRSYASDSSAGWNSRGDNTSSDFSSEGHDLSRRS